MRHRASILICSLAVTTQATAQDSISAKRDWIIGVSAGVPGYERQPVPQLLTIGLSVSQTKPGRLGTDFAIGTMPTALALGVAVLGARAGLVFPIALTPNVSLLPSAGASLVAGGGADAGVAALTGVNAGIATLIWTDNVGVRTGVTWHHFQDVRGAIWLFEFGVMRATR